jgi:CRP/FNR family transcriptional regulator
VRRLRAGEVLFEAGSGSDALFVIQAGEIVLVEPGPAPDATRTIARLGPGDAVGETDVLAGRPRSVRALAVTDVRLLALDRDSFRAMCLERPAIGLRMVERLATRAADLERRLAAAGMNDLVRPLARCLLRRSEPSAEGARLALGLRGLAEAAGLSLRDAHRGLQELLDRKLVRLVDDVLVVADPDALLACLDEDREAAGVATAR